MSADDKAAAAWDDYINQQQEEKIEELERQLTAAKERIQRLEEAGDRLAGTTPPSSDRYMAWIKAKEAKP